jgi:hypothetical protein
MTRAGALARLFARFDAMLAERGFLATGGRIIDATVVEARRPRLTQDEKATLRDGGTPEGWSKARTRQIGRDGRWTIKRGRKARPPEGAPRQAAEIAVPMFGYKNHLGIDRGHGFIRRFTVTHAARHDGSQLGAVLDANNTASGVWADTAYRSNANVEMLDRRGLRPEFQRGKSRGKPMPAHISRGDATRAGAQPGRACVRHREASHGLGRAQHRPGARHGADHPRDPRLQHAPAGLDRRETRARVTGPGARRTTKEPTKTDQQPATRAPPATTPASHLISARSAGYSRCPTAEGQEATRLPGS